jgi:hypothetical protein
MTGSSFLVLSDAERWTSWTIPHVWVHIRSEFDDPDHPYGQWSARLTRVGKATSTGPCLLMLEFLVDEAPWRQIQPGTVLPCFYGTRHLADLTVQPESPV